MSNSEETKMSVHTIELSDLEAEEQSSGPLLEKNIDLIKDVKVTLRVMLGETSISVDELFKLKKGSVIELAKPVDSPIDILLNGKVVARGTLVAAGDNFGIRITEINS